MDVCIVNVPNNFGYKTVQFYVDNKKFGDVLDDNSYIEDGFRFHDLYHILLPKYFNMNHSIFHLFTNPSSDESFSYNFEEVVVLSMFEYKKYSSVFLLELIQEILKQLCNNIVYSLEYIKNFIDFVYLIIQDIKHELDFKNKVNLYL